MARVFIAHSSKDAWLINPIADNMRLIGVEPYIAILEDPTPYPLPQKIDEAINSSVAMIVILSSDVAETKKTRDIVNWEISSAYAKKRPIYVFAEEGVDIPLMLNYITVYARYNPKNQASLNEISGKIHNIASQLKQSDDLGKAVGTFFMILLGIAFIGALIGDK